MFFDKKIKVEPYNKEKQKPIIRASICNGEQVAGFRDKATGIFTEVMLIKNDKDMNYFLKKYNIELSEISKEY
ncbi:MAG: aspartate dehydrogenase [Lachnospiraceae bacterium]|nr:aspartate dehydrogenase [Lachnospiraceae bacterium]MBO5145724.1 aspartate dehydrogenase [Lachnospiraceae bacterium]